MIIKCLEKNKVISVFTCSHQSDLTLLFSLLSDCYPSPFFYFPVTCVLAFEGPGNPIFFFGETLDWDCVCFWLSSGTKTKRHYFSSKSKKSKMHSQQRHPRMTINARVHLTCLGLGLVLWVQARKQQKRHTKDKDGRALCSSVGASFSRKCSPSALTLNLMFAEYATLSELLGQNK
jgi:hypothetical protein